MRSVLLETIVSEVSKHSNELAEEHIETISEAILKQLEEVASEDKLEKLVEIMKPDFLLIVDMLIPIVQEYESRIEQLLDSKVNNLISKL